SDVDKLCPRLGEEEKEKEKTLFISLDLETTHGHLKRNRGHDDDCLLVLIKAFDRAPKRDQLLLQKIKLGGGFLGRKVRRQTNQVGIAVHGLRRNGDWTSASDRGG